jgi:hypothetical protein
LSSHATPPMEQLCHDLSNVARIIRPPHRCLVSNTPAPPPESTISPSSTP